MPPRGPNRDRPGFSGCSQLARGVRRRGGRASPAGRAARAALARPGAPDPADARARSAHRRGRGQQRRGRRGRGRRGAEPGAELRLRARASAVQPQRQPCARLLAHDQYTVGLSDQAAIEDSPLRQARACASRSRAPRSPPPGCPASTRSGRSSSRSSPRTPGRAGARVARLRARRCRRHQRQDAPAQPDAPQHRRDQRGRPRAHRDAEARGRSGGRPGHRGAAAGARRARVPPRRARPGARLRGRRQDALKFGVPPPLAGAPTPTRSLRTAFDHRPDLLALGYQRASAEAAHRARASASASPTSRLSAQYTQTGDRGAERHPAADAQLRPARRRSRSSTSSRARSGRPRPTTTTQSLQRAKTTAQVVTDVATAVRRLLERAQRSSSAWRTRCSTERARARSTSRGCSIEKGAATLDGVPRRAARRTSPRTSSTCRTSPTTGPPSSSSSRRSEWSCD